MHMSSGTVINIRYGTESGRERGRLLRHAARLIAKRAWADEQRKLQRGEKTATRWNMFWLKKAVLKWTSCWSPNLSRGLFSQLNPGVWSGGAERNPFRLRAWGRQVDGPSSTYNPRPSTPSWPQTCTMLFLQSPVGGNIQSISDASLDRERLQETSSRNDRSVRCQKFTFSLGNWDCSPPWLKC